MFIAKGFNLFGQTPFGFAFFFVQSQNFRGSIQVLSLKCFRNGATRFSYHVKTSAFQYIFVLDMEPGTIFVENVFFQTFSISQKKT